MCLYVLSPLKATGSNWRLMLYQLPPVLHFVCIYVCPFNFVALLSQSFRQFCRGSTWVDKPVQLTSTCRDEANPKSHIYKQPTSCRYFDQLDDSAIVTEHHAVATMETTLKRKALDDRDSSSLKRKKV